MIVNGINYPRLRCRIGKRGSRRFYFDHGGKPRRWEPLGSDEARALARYRKLAATPQPIAGTVDAMLADCIPHAEYLRVRSWSNLRRYQKACSSRACSRSSR